MGLTGRAVPVGHGPVECPLRAGRPVRPNPTCPCAHKPCLALFCPQPTPVQCLQCGAPRWEGPGWQLQQRLAAALQAGAALSDALLPPHGADAPAAAAAKAAAAALARFRWEAAGAAAAAGGRAAAPDADGGRGGSDGEAPGRRGDAAAGLPTLDGSDHRFRELADLAAGMLAESRECWGLGAGVDWCRACPAFWVSSCNHVPPPAVHVHLPSAGPPTLPPGCCRAGAGGRRRRGGARTRRRAALQGHASERPGPGAAPAAVVAAAPCSGQPQPVAAAKCAIR